MNLVVKKHDLWMVSKLGFGKHIEKTFSNEPSFELLAWQTLLKFKTFKLNDRHFASAVEIQSKIGLFNNQFITNISIHLYSGHSRTLFGESNLTKIRTKGNRLRKLAIQIKTRKSSPKPIDHKNALKAVQHVLLTKFIFVGRFNLMNEKCLSR
jgi:hypothetical protein